MPPLISVIVPVYKVECYLKNCLESILSQTYQNIEVILVNDIAPDNCGEICYNYAKRDSRVKVIHKKHGGLSAARNAGMKIASGEYLGFVDSDDWIEPDMYEYLLSGIQRTGGDISCCGLCEERLHSSKEIGRKTDVCLGTAEALKVLLTNGGIQTTVVWNKLYRRSLWDGILFPDGRLSEDTATIYQVFAKSERICIMSKAKYHYRINPSGLMRATNLSRELDFWDAAKTRYNELLPIYPEFGELLKIDMIQAIMNIWSMMWELGASERDKWSVLLDEMAAYARKNYKSVLQLCNFGITGKLRTCLTPYNKSWAFLMCAILKKISDIKHGG